MLKYKIEIRFKDSQKKDFYLFDRLVQKYGSRLLEGLYILDGLCRDEEDETDYNKDYETLSKQEKNKKYKEKIVSQDFRDFY